MSCSNKFVIGPSFGIIDISYCSNIILFSQNFFSYFNQFFYFIIIYTHKQCTIIRKQVFRNFQTWVYHIKPIGVKASI